MNQHITMKNIVSMEIFYFEIVGGFGGFNVFSF